MSDRQSDVAQRARDSLASILSYYMNHVPESETPDFVERATSGIINIGMILEEVPSPKPPTAEQLYLKDVIGNEEAILNLSAEEKQLMLQAAAASI